MRNVSRVLRRDRSGSVAITFAFSITALLLTVGLAIDYSRSMTVRSALQNDLDAAILSAATKANETTAIKAAALQFITDNWRAKYNVSDRINLVVEKPEANVVRGSTSVRVPTTFMTLVGMSHVDVAVSSEIVLAGSTIEVALVLDVTESMIGAKIDALKASASELIDQAFEDDDAAEHVRMAIIPFADYVNIGEANRNAPWMDVPADSDTTTETCDPNFRPVTGQVNCRMENVTWYRDGIPVTSQVQQCDTTYGDPEYRCVTTTQQTRWWGCAASREHPHDVNDDQWHIPVPGAMNVGCGAPGIELTNDAAALKQRIEDITPFGSTYIPAGLFWGWAALSPQEPFSSARNYGERVDGVPVEKAMVLMTDGANTRSPDYVAKNHAAGDIVLANERTASLCTNIKAKGIKIYTVAFEVVDNAVKDMLRDCATSADHFYDAEDAAELQTAFADIGANLAPLRIAR